MKNESGLTDTEVKTVDICIEEYKQRTSELLILTEFQQNSIKIYLSLLIGTLTAYYFLFKNFEQFLLIGYVFAVLAQIPFYLLAHHVLNNGLLILYNAKYIDQKIGRRIKNILNNCDLFTWDRFLFEKKRKNAESDLSFRSDQLFPILSIVFLFCFSVFLLFHIWGVKNLHIPRNYLLFLCFLNFIINCFFIRKNLKKQRYLSKQFNTDQFFQ